MSPRAESRGFLIKVDFKQCEVVSASLDLII